MQKHHEQVEKLLIQKRKEVEDMGRDVISESGFQLAIKFFKGNKKAVKRFPTVKGIQYPRYDGLYEVIKLLSKRSYRLRHSQSGEMVERNYYQLK